jgi:hypothetical protein
VPQSPSERVRKIPSPGFDSRTVQPVASRCTDWTIPLCEFCSEINYVFSKQSITRLLRFLIHTFMYKVVQIWPGLIVCKQVTVCPGHIWTTLYFYRREAPSCILWERIFARLFQQQQAMWKINRKNDRGRAGKKAAHPSGVWRRTAATGKVSSEKKLFYLCLLYVYVITEKFHVSRKFVSFDSSILRKKNALLFLSRIDKTLFQHTQIWVPPAILR